MSLIIISFAEREKRVGPCTSCRHWPAKPAPLLLQVKSTGRALRHLGAQAATVHVPCSPNESLPCELIRSSLPLQHIWKLGLPCVAIAKCAYCHSRFSRLGATVPPALPANYLRYPEPVVEKRPHEHAFDKTLTLLTIKQWVGTMPWCTRKHLPMGSN